MDKIDHRKDKIVLYAIFGDKSAPCATTCLVMIDSGDFLKITKNRSPQGKNRHFWRFLITSDQAGGGGGEVS